MKIGRSAKIAIVAAVLTANALPAMAIGQVSSKDGGALAWSNTATGYIKDAKGDNLGVQGQFMVGGTKNKLDNYGGFGTTLQKTYSGRISSLAACTIYNFSPDDCSSFVS